MIILGIETSCDETSAAVLDGRKVLSNTVFSQVDTHRLYGGVVPEIAAREHMSKLPAVVAQALEEAGKKFGDIDAVAATYGPGLAGSLITGLSYAKALAYSLKKKFVAVNHLEAHLLSPFIEYPDFDYPFIGVVVSGGHTNIYYAKNAGEYELIAGTRDDAAGEAFDKVAKLLGLPYPGGPSISKAAKAGNAKKIVFPQAQMKDKSNDFSFSGLKTSVLNFMNRNQAKIKSGEVSIDDIAAAFQKSAVRAVVNKLRRINREYKAKRIALTGGVAANSFLKEETLRYAAEQGVKVYVPSMLLCTDNGAMVANAAYEHLRLGKESGLSVEADPGLKL